MSSRAFAGRAIADNLIELVELNLIDCSFNLSLCRRGLGCGRGGGWETGHQRLLRCDGRRGCTRWVLVSVQQQQQRQHHPRMPTRRIHHLSSILFTRVPCIPSTPSPLVPTPRRLGVRRRLRAAARLRRCSRALCCSCALLHCCWLRRRGDAAGAGAVQQALVCCSCGCARDFCVSFSACWTTACSHRRSSCPSCFQA